MEELKIGGIQFQAHDLGGHRSGASLSPDGNRGCYRPLTRFSCLSARRLWSDYLAGVDAIVYIIDAYDRDRFAEAKTELDVSELRRTSESPNCSLTPPLDLAGPPVWRAAGKLSIFDSGK